MMIFSHYLCSSVMALFFLSISGEVFWPYFFGGLVLVIGLAMFDTSEVRQARGLEKLIPFGPLLFAIPMAIFGGDHLAVAKFVAMIVPKWIPWHLFWAYFVGVALIAAALSLVTRINWRLAALLLGIMLFLFVLLLHIPSCLASSFGKISVTIGLRDLALSGGALALAAWQTERGARASGGLQFLRSRNFGGKLIFVTRFMIAIPMAVFGVDQILNPTYAPGIPQENTELFMTMPAWIPAHAFWGYLSGAIFIACALGMISGKYARPAATVLGLTVLVLILLVFIPITVAKPSDMVGGLNYLAIHFALAGMALQLAGALPGD